ncbi:hypothetical protein NQ315_005380 [Exocentrus adspersus]|uniref:Metallothionein n=1 Tax=Exocentrus adspersus TaxID=1586481 RepID=A0AAV8W332_9CUCU|nr:hypothetical protein NQ315_005380 [Exocentrus adspersus]
MSDCCKAKQEEKKEGGCIRILPKKCTLTTLEGEKVDCECVCNCTSKTCTEDCKCDCKCTPENAVKDTDGKYRCKCDCSC